MTRHNPNAIVGCWNNCGNCIRGLHSKCTSKKCECEGKEKGIDRKGVKHVS